MKEAISEDVDIMNRQENVSDELNKVKELVYNYIKQLRKAQLLNSNYLKVDSFLKELELSEDIREDKMTDIELHNRIKDGVLSWMGSDEIIKYVMTNYPKVFEMYTKKEKKSTEEEEEEVEPTHELNTIKRIINEPTILTTEELYKKIENLYFENKKNLKLLEDLRNQNENLIETISKNDEDVTEVITLFKNVYQYLKQKIHDLEYAINTQEKSYGNLQEENKQLLQEVYLKIYIE